MKKMFKGFVVDLIKSRELILDLVKRDYKQQHQGSYLGLLWNYLQPILFIAVLYTVFTLGLRTGREIDSMPFSLYLISGMVCWLYFTANLTAITSVIRNYRFLVKKVDFRLSILPIVKLLSSLLPHAVLLLITIAIAIYNGILPGWHSLQLLYYYCCMVALLLGLGWLTSSTSLFVKDVSNLVALITQFGFWLTPIFWHIDSMPEKLQWILKLNPAYYLVTGYRDAITGNAFFWQRPQETLVFWAITLLLLVSGAMIFKKLKPHFAEVI
ncbi:MAG: ABC-type polysaccharide/polyol phosphate export permease [Pseudomonadales bacterium]|jgi:ABC-type polysaccharide/polyol phosphate export permease